MHKFMYVNWCVVVVRSERSFAAVSDDREGERSECISACLVIALQSKKSGVKGRSL